MEVDGCGSGGAAVADAKAGGGGSGSEAEKKNTPEGEPKLKRKMKTVAQLEILEKTYALGAYPSEELRAELSVKLGLSDRQLQMWFCHRRLKGRKVPTEKRQKKEASAGMVVGLSSGVGDEIVVDHGNEVGNEHVLGSESSTIRLVEIQPRLNRVFHRTGTALARIGTELPSVKRYYKPPQAISELRAIAFVEAQLGERLREDGPILGMEFDPLPPGAFGAPLVASQQQKPGLQLYEAQVYERPDAKVIKGATRLVREYQFLPEQPSIRDDICERAAPSHIYGSSSDAQSSRTALSSGRSFMLGSEQLAHGQSYHGQISGLSLLPQLGKQGNHLSPTSGEVELVSKRTSFESIGLDAHCVALPIVGVENPFLSSDQWATNDAERLDRKWKSEEARIAREVEAHERRIRKELEKQDLLRRKREEQMKKEMERQDKERRKEEERLLREKQREEERCQREQRREMERREKFLQKESIRVEKMRLKEEMRREKEAARLKAANDRATTRRIAKESMELIDDERLELMELAASSRGLRSVLALDNEALQDLESLRDRLIEYPTKTVHLKKPFGFKPWTDSEDSVGSLLMVWKFLITFADVLGLWPFTLDEFVQAFHEYDPRLLGEIHISLLRTIVKDIEDVARSPATTVGANQNSAASPGGGHPQIVEGAYAWGFDIRSWQLHLNPLTWPEILRQFALSAGFGPTLKKRSMEQAYLFDENEGNDGGNIISNLRNGVAAENAVAKMRQRGISNLRRSRHRLTPGTVKFAAFHVLSLEGSNGLNILEVADKIQKSGLRDLTTSKTPEASIAAALSRDTKLFERTAPSTYCVRTPYRKDPVDAEAILSAAREKVQVYKNGCLDAEEADDAEKEDAERDEDSESDVAEEPDVDDLDTELKPDKEAVCSLEAIYEGKALSGNIKENSSCELIVVPESGKTNIDMEKSESLTELKGTGTFVDQTIVSFGDNLEAAYPDQGESIIDESYNGELWVQGLMEGEYSDLSVQERLDALVALIGVANEGNSVRVILEERLEGANALKKQMWSEAQLDKRRVKEEYALKMQYPLVGGNRVELNSLGNAVDGRRSPFLAVDGTSELTSTNIANQEEDLGDSQRIPNYSDNITTGRNMKTQDFSSSDNLLLQQFAYASEKSWSEIKAYIGHRAEEIYVYKSLPLGQDRRRNRYWQFMTSPSHNDPGSGRIFVELHDGCWRLIDSVEDFDALLASLDVRGIREFHLHSMLQRIELSFKQNAKNLCSNSGNQDGNIVKSEVSGESPKNRSCIAHPDVTEPLSSCAIISLGSDEREQNDTLKRYRHFEKWMWEECFSSTTLCALKFGKTERRRLLSICNNCCDCYFFEEHHCPFCHKNHSTSLKSSSLSEHITQCKEKIQEVNDRALHKLEFSPPLRIRLLKAQLASVEASIPPEALEDFWSEDYRNSWGMKLQTASSAEELLQILTLLESAIKSDFLMSDYETTCELLSSDNLKGQTSNNFPSLEMIPVLPWIPQTASAVALRLMEFDTSICYTLLQKEDFQREKGSCNIITIPARYAVGKNSGQDRWTEHLHEAGNVPQDPWDTSCSMHNSSGQGRSRGRGGRSGIRAGRSQRRVTGSSIRERTATNKDRFGPLLGWKDQARGRGGRKRARRTGRSRQKPAKRVPEKAASQKASSDANAYEKTCSSHEIEWFGEEPVQAEVGNIIISDRSGFDDDNGQATGDDYDDLVAENYSGVFSGKPGPSMEGLNYGTGGEDGNDDVDDDADEGNDHEDDGQEEEDEEYCNGNSDVDGNKFIGEEQMRNLNKEVGFSSSDYSD